MNFDFKKLVEKFIFLGSKWLLIPFYIKLVFTLGILLFYFCWEGSLSSGHMMETLEAVDIVMIANLVRMIITGSYNSFVDKAHGYEGEKVSSGMLKVKMATSIMGVSSIHLLQSFITADSDNMSWDLIYKQVFIHSIFIVGCLILAIVDYLHCKSETTTH